MLLILTDIVNSMILNLSSHQNKKYSDKNQATINFPVFLFLSFWVDVGTKNKTQRHVETCFT